MLSSQALTAFIAEKPKSCLNIGDQSNSNHTKILEKNNIKVQTISLIGPADTVGPYHNIYCSGQEAIWCSHVLEHQRNPGTFLDKIFSDLNEGGLLAITVPPASAALKGGHVTIWNQATLIYQLILAGFNCQKARCWRYEYNTSVIVRKEMIQLKNLTYNHKDLEVIKLYMPEDYIYD